MGDMRMVWSVRSRRRMQLLVAACCATLALGGCGGASGGGSSSATGGGAAGGTQLQHVDGTLKVNGDTVTVAPGGGSQEVQLTLGREVPAAQVKAMTASGERARVLYRGSTAVQVQAVSAAARQSPHVTGTITSVSATSLTLATDGGDKTFRIRPAEREVMDVAHLKEHQAGGEPVTVYYQGNAAIYYEDA